MIEQLEMEVKSRDERGKNAARRLRAAGGVPATLYGLGKDPVSLALDKKAITGLLSHREKRNGVLNLKGGAEGTAMAVDWQVDPVHGYLPSGSVAGLIEDRPSCAELVARIVEEAERTLKQLGL